jgi:glycosyltransferase involved in cell wall biosynthesis
VLTITPLYPSEARPVRGTFVRTRVEALRKEGIDVEVILIQGPNQKLAYLAAARELRRRMNAGGIDLINAVYGLAGIVARTEWRAPLVVTFVGSDGLGDVGASGRTTALGRLERASSRLLSRVVDEVIVESEVMARALPRRDVHVIPHGVDFELFTPTDRAHARELLGLDPDRCYLLFPADPSWPRKNFPLAEAASERLRADGVEHELLAVFKETQARLALYMSACDVLVFPTHLEGSPNVIKQAMVCNLPIVATDVGDVRELIGTTPGCYVTEPTAEAFAANLREVLDARQRTDGRERVSFLENGLIARRVIEVFELALSKRDRSMAPSPSVG